MAGLGIGEYAPIDIGGIAVDIVVLIMQGIASQSSTVGSTLAIVLVLALLLVLVGTAFGLILAVVGGVYALTKMKGKGKHSL